MRTIVLIFVLSTALISSCITSHYDRSPVQKQRDFVVALETHTSGNIKHYAHPVHLDVQKIKEMMKSFKYIRKEGVFSRKDAEPVFQQKEIDRLAQPLASALSGAGTSQHVRFVSLNKKKALKVMTTFYQTEGILFRDADSRINFVFLEINDRVSSEDPITLVAEFTGKDPMKVTKSEVKLFSEPAVFKHYASADGRVFPIWMTAVADEAVRKEAVSISNDAPRQNQPKEKQATGMENPPAAVGTMSQQDEIKEKLTYLKGLMDEGLITEADYNTRKKMLLDKLK